MQGRKTGTVVDIDQQYLKHDNFWYITYTCISMVGLKGCEIRVKSNTRIKYSKFNVKDKDTKP